LIDGGTASKDSLYSNRNHEKHDSRPNRLRLLVGFNSVMSPEAANSFTPPSSPDHRFAHATHILEQAMADRAFPGCAFGVLAGGKTILLDARGRFTYGYDAPVVAAETVFDIASITKVLATTAMAMLLHQRGQLDLETPLGELLPGFVSGRAHGDGAHLAGVRPVLSDRRHAGRAP
jgi:CubicO group peptidase (beta-lactamase class C family)